MWCLETLEKINQESLKTEDAREIYENLGITTMDYKSEEESDEETPVR